MSRLEVGIRIPYHVHLVSLGYSGHNPHEIVGFGLHPRMVSWKDACSNFKVVAFSVNFVVA